MENDIENFDGFKTLTKMETERGNYFRRSHVMVGRGINYPPIVKIPLWDSRTHTTLMTEDTLDNPTPTYFARYERGVDDGGKFLWYNYKGDDS